MHFKVYFQFNMNFFHILRIIYSWIKSYIFGLLMIIKMYYENKLVGNKKCWFLSLILPNFFNYGMNVGIYLIELLSILMVD